ncbi:hypothetical protein BDU57DRAFT_582916 [Ampelomyces quisqualis]|uniref:Uncharacterized protein n=1 Tax=Ampelomyces quisqualis TaxID=50730 RepID=A0A6A5QCD4_AMPQU|nr:hypothetical protein BDU57DRAFT_582916 [Ampelomyces quisqualis]
MAPTAKARQAPKGDHKSNTQWEPNEIEPESFIPDPTPPYIMRKYTGTFRTKPTDASTPKTITISIAKYMLYLKHTPTPLEVKKPAPAKPNETPSATNPPKPAKTRITKPPTKTKKPTVPVPKATVSAKATIATASGAAAATKPVLLAAPTLHTATAAPTTPLGPRVALFLNVNGAPQVRVGGATPEEAVLNAEVQAVARTYPHNGLVSFDVRMGEIGGVRVGREMYVRFAEKEEEEEGEEV